MIHVNKVFEMLESRRRERAFKQFKRDWWWFDKANESHVHQLSAVWEILRRTRAFNQLNEKMARWRDAMKKAERQSFEGVVQKGKLMSSLREMIPQSPPAAAELCDMVGVWQNMLANGWTPDKTYLQASENSNVQCALPGGKLARIPPTYGGKNFGVPIVLPRQVASRGHTSLLIELCEARMEENRKRLIHLAGSVGPTQTLRFLAEHGKTVSLEDGKYLAIQFPLNQSAEALKALLVSWLDSIQHSAEWNPPSDQPDVYSRGPSLLTATANALEAIAFFPATQPRNVIERGFKTLIRPERIAKQLPSVRDEWVQWDFAERVKCDNQRTPKNEILKRARAAWDEAERYSRPVRQSTTRPIRPTDDLINLACADCAPFYRRKRDDLPDALPVKNDADFNKRMATGLRLISSQDDIFLPLLDAM